jgi:hypothetical protein
LTTRIVSTEADRELLVKFIKAHKMPFTAVVTKGGKRSAQQNNTQWLWIQEIADQLDDRTAQEWQGYCKLHGGVPILRAENEEFREKYDSAIRPLSYETKLEIMTHFDFPVTSRMTVAQKMKYLDWMQQHFAEQGVVLTQPDEMGLR